MQKVLCVDDSSDLLDIYSFNFEMAGYEVVTAMSGYAAIEKLKEQQFCAVFSDIRMPNGDGIELLKYVQQGMQEEKKPLVFLITGYADYDEATIKDLGGQALFIKPDDIERFVDVVSETLDSHNRNDTEAS